MEQPAIFLVDLPGTLASTKRYVDVFARHLYGGVQFRDVRVQISTLHVAVEEEGGVERDRPVVPFLVQLADERIVQVVGGGPPLDVNRGLAALHATASRPASRGRFTETTAFATSGDTLFPIIRTWPAFVFAGERS